MAQALSTMNGILMGKMKPPRRGGGVKVGRGPGEAGNPGSVFPNPTLPVPKNPPVSFPNPSQPVPKVGSYPNPTFPVPKIK